MSDCKGIVHLLDYGAGNVRSVRNAVKELGYSIVDVSDPSDIDEAQTLLFPGVGAFQTAMEFLNSSGYGEALKKYIQSNRKFLGICLGLQTLFEGSEEYPDLKGLGIIKGVVKKFPEGEFSVPHIGWNGIRRRKKSSLFQEFQDDNEIRAYFVHSYRALATSENSDWVLSTTNYGDGEFISSIQKGNVVATQFHPEKSGKVGLSIIQGFLGSNTTGKPFEIPVTPAPTLLAKRIIACLDVRSNDNGDLVVTKGDQYDVRESSSSNGKGSVRNLGKPVDLCKRYYNEGADEITFLNICSFRQETIGDLPMLQVLEAASREVFVPLTVGGGIRGYTDSDGHKWSALDVASRYFRSGADKVSIGSDAVYAAEEYLKNGKKCTGNSSIEEISKVYGRQAVVVSIDPRRVYLSNADQGEGLGYTVVKLSKLGPKGEKYCWYQATVRGGREGRSIDAVQLAQICETLGAGEILLNSVDMDGQKEGFDHNLIQAVKDNVNIPVIASSGAGKPQHFSEVFKSTDCHAALAAGIFHRNEVPIHEVKSELLKSNIPVRV